MIRAFGSDTATRILELRAEMMMVIDEEWVKTRVAEQGAEDERRLAQAEAEAARSGKEVFELDAFEQCYDTSTELGFLPPRDVREYRLKLKYYVQYPDTMTLKEFADFMSSLDVWR